MDTPLIDGKYKSMITKKDKTLNYLIRSGFKPILDKEHQIYTTDINTDEQLREICTFLFHNIGVFMETIPTYYQSTYESFRVKIDDFYFYLILPKK
jgi:hypothetical protein